jgi:hypothetical protein
MAYSTCGMVISTSAPSLDRRVDMRHAERRLAGEEVNRPNDLEEHRQGWCWQESPGFTPSLDCNIRVFGLHSVFGFSIAFNPKLREAQCATAPI